LAASDASLLELPEAEAIAKLGTLGIEIMVQDMRRDLERMGVVYNVWFREQSLFDSGEVAQTLELLRQNGHVAEKEGAIWFVSTALGQEKDNVLIRSDTKKTPTYFVSDIAYHQNKFRKREFNRVINVWGADHQGHIPRLKAALNAIDLNPDDLTIIVMQMVTLNGTIIKKKNGNVVLLRDVLDLVGRDPVRFNLVSRAAETQMDFNLDLAVKQSNENPVYYVQYAHARICSILRLAAEKNIDFSQADLSLLGNGPEQNLIRQMLLLPEVIEEAARTLEPHRLPYYAQELASKFHAFYTDNRVVDEAALSLSQARLQLVEAVKITLAKTLHLMGMDAPVTM
jgi:arginyl-tRNA synthetase